MKRLLCRMLLITILSVQAMPAPVRAETTDKVVFHVNEPEKVALLVETVRYLHKYKPTIEIAIVVNGPAVTRLTYQLDYAAALLENSDWVGACSVGLLLNAMRRDQLAEGVVFIEQTGVSALIDFRRRHYTYIKI